MQSPGAPLISTIGHIDKKRRLSIEREGALLNSKRVHTEFSSGLIQHGSPQFLDRSTDTSVAAVGAWSLTFHFPYAGLGQTQCSEPCSLTLLEGQTSFHTRTRYHQTIDRMIRKLLVFCKTEHGAHNWTTLGRHQLLSKLTLTAYILAHFREDPWL